MKRAKKIDDIKARLIEAIEDEMDLVDKEVDRLETQRAKLQEQIDLLKTRI